MNMSSGFQSFVKKKDTEPMKIKLISYLMDMKSIILGKSI